MEDARFVRLVDDDGAGTYYATYTAYDGAHVSSQLLSTDDFRTFSSTQLTGRGARDKGMALFPRLIGGRYVALSRLGPRDQRHRHVRRPDGVGRPGLVAAPGRGVGPHPARQLRVADRVARRLDHPHPRRGPMRRYAIGAELLDLEDPTRVIGHLTEPLLAPIEEERDGYVPNVVYSCGAMLHGEHIVVPYGMADANVGVATIRLDQLLDRLT